MKGLAVYTVCYMLLSIFVTLVAYEKHEKLALISVMVMLPVLIFSVLYLVRREK